MNRVLYKTHGTTGALTTNTNGMPGLQETWCITDQTLIQTVQKICTNFQCKRNQIVTARARQTVRSYHLKDTFSIGQTTLKSHKKEKKQR